MNHAPEGDDLTAVSYRVLGRVKQEAQCGRGQASPPHLPWFVERLWTNGPKVLQSGLHGTAQEVEDVGHSRLGGVDCPFGGKCALLLTRKAGLFGYLQESVCRRLKRWLNVRDWAAEPDWRRAGHT